MLVGGVERALWLWVCRWFRGGRERVPSAAVFRAVGGWLWGAGLLGSWVAWGLRWARRRGLALP